MPAKKKRKLDIDTSQRNLVIVESPAKAKTIKKYLWPWFEVVASMWHIRDLPKKNAIDVDNNFATTYEVSPDKKSIVTSLKKAAKEMEEVWIATDEDREWEAIWWHLCEAMSLDPSSTKRIVFHEITEDAIKKAVSEPRTVDLDLVHAQQARRVLDRLVWFDLSPVLRKKVKTWLSAWRVQSVAVRLLVDREREIMKFDPEVFFKTKWTFVTDWWDIFEAELDSQFASLHDAQTFLEESVWAAYTIKKISQTPWKRKPWAPFTTSSLQQQASTRYWFPVARTMQIAQRLYESGHITYMRTDSMNLSQSALKACEVEIKKSYGDKYHNQRTFKSKKKWAQEAHEAIRPTNMAISRAGDDEDQKKLYHLIWQRTIASQMSDANTKKTSAIIDISTRSEEYQAKWEIVTFDWFLVVFDKKKDDTLLPKLTEWDVVNSERVVSTQQFSKPPARYTEASLVKKLEELWIWRPSTYAPTINTIQKRWYVSKWIGEWTATDFQVLTLVWKDIEQEFITKKIQATKGKLVPSDVWIVVTDFLKQHFESIMDYQFTASVEQEFDEIASWKRVWHEMLHEFYLPFHKQVNEVTENAERASWERILWDDPVSWKVVKVRVWRYWPLAQIWESDDEEVKFASLRGDVHLESISLEQALELFALPRDLWEREWKMIKASIWRFWPYVQWWSVFMSLKEDDPYTIEFDKWLELIELKIEKEKLALLQEFIFKDKEGIVKMWRWWPFIKRNRLNIRLPKWTDWATVSQSEIEEYIENELWSKKSTSKKKKKSTTKKKATKKKTK